MSIHVRKALMEDVPDINTILDNCKHLLKKSGSPQWSNEDEPTLESVVKAIEEQLVYLLIINNTIVGTSILTNKVEQAYSDIIYGNWNESNSPYYSIHRFAIDPSQNGKGYAKLFFQLLCLVAREEGAKDIRVDTHPVNQAMQHVILSNGFDFKGIITLPIQNGERYAYQKIIQ